MDIGRFGLFLHRVCHLGNDLTRLWENPSYHVWELRRRRTGIDNARWEAMATKSLQVGYERFRGRGWRVGFRF